MISSARSNKFYPVSGLSVSGKIKIFIVKILFSLVHLFVNRKWSNPRHNFEENPIHFKFKDILYLGYKYYWRPHETGMERFKSNRFKNVQLIKSNTSICMHAGGDLMPYEMLLNGKAEEIWGLAGDDFFNADIVMANLECPMDYNQDKGFVPEVMLNDMLFNGSEELMNVFTASNKYKFDVLTLANNHMLDAGFEGLANTMSQLDKMGIRHTGARRDEKEDNFLIIKENNISIGLVNFTYSLNRVEIEKGKEKLVNYLEINDPEVDLSTLIQLADAAKNAGAEVLIAYLHMGNAYQCYPSEHIQKQVHKLVRLCCFDVVFISHPHNLQPGEIIPFSCKYSGKQKNSIVYYSLGDFVAYDIFNWSHLTGYAKLTIQKNKDEILISPSFEFLYLQRDLNGKLKFIPWKTALEKSIYQDEKFNFLLEWYNKHAQYFFSDATI